ncbi:hypothetical protein XOC_2257 [Xanthomonas oryzae pv. oryzicola BLS256]|uniref:Uncharacterized protein n=1 Tax=Xanthomonas oryzae pv. oryzicola (strain BLS256) TaxID=383407 RepID=G7TE69_XANOB|nr:hypothetical protein XOC_2257 [Xanthomonas oryzae pv. oryzicola BLS256]
MRAGGRHGLICGFYALATFWLFTLGVIWSAPIHVGRARDALTDCGTRRKPVHGGSMAASMPPTVPQSVRTPRQTVGRQSGEGLHVVWRTMGSGSDVP